MCFGNFIDEGKGYRIDTPTTPTTWSNSLFNDEYYMVVSQSLQGKSSTVSNFEQQAFTTGYRYFYILDHETGDVWNPNYYPLQKDYDSYNCIHYYNRTEMVSVRNGVRAAIQVFVPTNGLHEIWTVSITNLSSETKDLSVFSAFGFSDHGVMGGECNYDKEKGILYKYSFPYHIFYEEQDKVKDKPCRTYLFSDVTPFSWDMSKRRFFGCDDIGVLPESVKRGECSKIKAEAEEYCGAFQHKYKLESGKEAIFNLMIGVTATMEEMVRLKRGFNREYISNELMLSENHWEHMFNIFTIKTPDKGLDYFMNYWLKKQSVMLTRLNRGTTYCPVRNPLQDIMGYSLIDPKGAKVMMLKLLRRQQKDGFIQQWYMTDDSPAKGLCLLKHTDGYMAGTLFSGSYSSNW